MMNDLIFTIKMSVIMAAILAIIIFIPMATYEAGYWDGRLSVMREEAEADDDGQSLHDSKKIRVHSEFGQTGDRVFIPYESNSYGDIVADGDLMFRPSTETLHVESDRWPRSISGSAVSKAILNPEPFYSTHTQHSLLLVIGNDFYDPILTIGDTRKIQAGEAKLSHWLLTRADGTTEPLKPPVRLDPVVEREQ